MSMLERSTAKPVNKTKDTVNSSFVSRKSSVSAKESLAASSAGGADLRKMRRGPALSKGTVRFLEQRQAEWRNQFERMGKDTFSDHGNPTSRETGPNEHSRCCSCEKCLNLSQKWAEDKERDALSRFGQHPDHTSEALRKKKEKPVFLHSEHPEHERTTPYTTEEERKIKELGLPPWWERLWE